MIKKIIFIFVKYFEEKDWSIFNCPYFLEQGYKVEIWTLVQIHYKGKAKEPLHLFRDYEVKYFEKIDKFKYEIQKNNRKHTIFLIYPSLGENNETGYLIRRLIRQNGFQYCDYCYPPVFSYIVNEKIPNTWKDITHYYLKNIRNKEMIKDLFFSLIYPPRYVFMTAEDKWWSLANKYDILKSGKLKYINTPDYDNFLLGNEKQDFLVLSREGLQENKYIVFLDEAYSHHSDILNQGLKSWVTEDIYGRELRNLFDVLETQMNMEVVIALHPKAEYKDSSVFGNRKMIHGESRVLIKYSNLVIADLSTAFSYIILYKKRFLMYTTNQLIRNSRYHISMQRTLAKFLECRIMNISKTIPIGSLDEYINKANEEKRKIYLKRLVCSRKKGDNATSAQIIDNCLKEF